MLSTISTSISLMIPLPGLATYCSFKSLASQYHLISAVYKNDQRNIRKVREATSKLRVNLIHPLRPGKKLLVLDIDYSMVHN